MRAAFLAAICVSLPLTAGRGQHATVMGRVVVRGSGAPVGFASISVLPSGDQRLAGEGGAFVLGDLPAGDVRLRFRHVGFSPKDTALIVQPNDTVQVRIEMTHLALDLP